MIDFHVAPKDAIEEESVVNLSAGSKCFPIQTSVGGVKKNFYSIELVSSKEWKSDCKENSS